MLIDGRAAVERLIERIPLLGVGQAGPIVLALADLAREENEAIERRLKQLFSACGCGSGAGFAFGSLALYSVYAYSSGALRDIGGVGIALLAVAVFMAGGGLGKMTGMLRARRQLLRTLRDLRDRLPVTNADRA